MKIPEYFHVLYVEDNEDERLMVAMMLGFANIKVITASTVYEAWHSAQITHFDLYLLDLQFPGGDSLDLCRSLRKYFPQTPIVFYSGNAYESDKEKGLAAGANVYLTKPYLDDLAVAVKQTIEKTANLMHEAVTTTAEAQLRTRQTDQVSYL